MTLPIAKLEDEPGAMSADALGAGSDTTPALERGPVVELELLGRFSITLAGRPLEAVRGSRQEALVALLALNRGTPLARQQVAATLWPESSDPQALTNLRRELHLLRRALPEADDVLAVAGRNVEWRAAGPSRLDVEAFEAAARRGLAGDATALEEAARRYRGPLLPTCYDDWIGSERDRLHATFVDVTDALIGRHEERGEHRRAIELLRTRIRLDPLDERQYRRLMRVAARAGERSTALQAYHACVTKLRRELGVEPSVETRRVYERLLEGADVQGGDGAAERSPGIERRAAASATIGPSVPAATMPASAPAPPLVGRTLERAALADALADANRMGPRLVALRGEAGIGKTRLLEELVRGAVARGHSTAYTRSYAAEGALAYAPIADWLRADAIRPALDTLDAVWLTELARLVPDLQAAHPRLERPAAMTESWQRTRLFEAVGRAIEAAPTPLVLVLDDVQWADTDTLEALTFALRSDAVGLLLALGIRAEEERPNHALASLLRDLRRRDRLLELELSPLSEAETAELAAEAVGAELPPDVRSRLFDETEGHPLYVLEIARGGAAALADRTAGADGLRVPPRMQALIASRLGRLSEDAIGVVELAATIGRAFTFELLEAASDLEAPALARAVDELWQQQIVAERALNSYDFTHDRIREVAYARTGPVRRRLLHRRIAQALVVLHAADLDLVSGQIATHHDAAGLVADAIDWYERAAEVARRVSANAEALAHLRRAIALLAATPAGSDRDRRELGLQRSLGPAIVADRGYATGEFGAALERVLELAERIDDREAAAYALDGLASAHYVRSELAAALETGRRSLVLATDHPELLTGCEATVGGTLVALGELGSGIAHFEAAVRAYLPGRSYLPTGIDPGVHAMAWESHALWLAGWPVRAIARSDEALALAARSGPHSLALANAYAAMLLQFDGDEEGMAELASGALELCERYRFAYYGEWGAILLAWHERASDPDAADRISAALAKLRAAGAEARRPYYLGLLAQAHQAAGRPDRARSVLGAALSTAHASQDAFWVPEIHRLIALLAPEPARSAGLRAAIEAGIRQGSQSLAVRATIDLVESEAGARDELRALLADWPEAAPSGLFEEAGRLLDERRTISERSALDRRAQPPAVEETTA
jgi:DNA-binding SARP family transcriptional activator